MLQAAADLGFTQADVTSAFSTVGVTCIPPQPPGVLSNGVPVTGVSGDAGSERLWTLAVPAGATGLKFVTAGGSGDADLYVKFGSAPTTASYDCRSIGGTNAETCNIATAQAGTYYVLISGYSAYSGLSLTGSYTGGGGGNTAPIANFGFTISRLTANFTDTSTDSDGTIASRLWNFGDGTTSTAANPSHTYAAAGTYTVTLTVTDDDGATGSKSQIVRVKKTGKP